MRVGHADKFQCLAHDRVLDLIDRWRALSQGYALMAPDPYEEFHGAGVPMRIVASDSRRVLVARR